MPTACTCSWVTSFALRIKRQQVDSLLKTLSLLGAVMVIDFMCKLLPYKQTEAQADAFGKHGTSTHGVVVILKGLPPELDARVKHWASLSTQEQQALRDDIAAAGALHCSSGC